MADSDIIQDGDLVQLKSGGPKMTVTDASYGVSTGVKDGVKCQWFEGNRATEDVFERFALRKVDPNAGGFQSVPLRRT